MTSLHNDWKKLATMASSQPDDSEIEKAFMDSAFAAISNKARPLMQSPYRLGFEIVFKNEDNTRMVGIFAFRIPGAGLLYAPVFFLSGEIKGTDLLYQHSNKKFVPLTEEWVRYLLEAGTSESGIGVERRFTTSIQQHLNLHKLKSPTIGNVGKSASAEEAPDYRAAWGEIEKLAAKRELPPLLRDFIVQDGGASAVELLAGAMEQNFKFANHVHRLVPAEVFAPVDLSVKSAAAPAPVLVVHRGPISESIKCASADYFRRGFWLEDTRKAAALSEVFDTVSSEITSPGEPGVYEVIMKGGFTQPVFCARQNNDSLPYQGQFAAPVEDCCGGWKGTGHDQPYVLIDQESQQVLTDAKRVMGRNLQPFDCGQEKRDDKGEPTWLLQKMETGKAYCLYDCASKTLTRPLTVTGKRTVDGVTCYTVNEGGSTSPRELRHNPEFTKVKIKEGIVGADARFIEVKTKTEEAGSYKYQVFPCDFAPGSQADVTQFLLAGGVKFASVRRVDTDFVLRYGAKRQTVGMSKLAMTCFVAKHLALHGDAATALVERAEEKGQAEFCYLPAKSASAVQLQAEPQFDPQLDPQFGVLQDPQPSYTVGTDFQPEPLPPQRIGDAWDPANLRGLMQTANPSQLAEIAQQSGMPNLFEHGVVGELVKTYDASAMIQKYVPKLEDALDCLGRILFLLYWKPTDFKKTYGADDLLNKENEILSNFKSFGDLLLDLLKQTRPNRAGSVATGT